MTKYMAWIDLETTGSDENDTYASILEVGCIITNEYLNKIDTFHSLVRPVCGHSERFKQYMEPVVVDMHNENGLFEELETAAAAEDLMPVDFVDETFADYLANYTQDGQVIMAGAGVTYFDKFWIKKFMPYSMQWLTRYGVDVSVIRRFMRDKYGTLPNKTFNREYGDDRPHRSLPDVERAIAEYKFYLEYPQMTKPFVLTAIHPNR